MGPAPFPPIMRSDSNRRGLTPGILAWLGLGIVLAIGQNLLWRDVWSMVLFVWWAYLILTVVVLLRLLMQSRMFGVRANPASLLWTLAVIAALLWWWRPLWSQMGEELIDQFRGPGTESVQPRSLARGGDVAIPRPNEGRLTDRLRAG